MDEKLRPGHEVMHLHQQRQQIPSSGVSVNPAVSALSWPMSFASGTTPSHERSSSAPGLGVDLTPSGGTRYDPIRHDHSPLQYDEPVDKQVKRRRPENGEPPSEQQQQQQDSNRYNYTYEPQKIVTPTNSLQSGKRSHVCDICGATFTRQHNLKSHFLTHTSSKKEFICSECGSEFRRSHDLKRHQKLHTGEKPFACHTCGRRFARADALGRHTKSIGDNGCVNSRRATSDNGSAGETANAFHIAPIEPRDEPTRESLQQLLMNRSSTPMEDEDEHISPSLRRASTNALEDHGGVSATKSLPPLRTGFPFEHNQSTSNAREILPSPTFGLPAAFEARSSSAHPLSFDRTSVQQEAAQASESSSGSVQPMVPLQRYKQLEAEHQAAMERIRHFEGDAEAAK